MIEDRKATIITELNYWKKNKMLPAVYCDYLLALYTNGEEAVDEEIKSENNGLSILKLSQLLLVIMLVPVAILVMYTSLFLGYIQLGVLSLFSLYSFWYYKALRQKQDPFYHVSFVVFLLLIFLSTIFLSDTYFYFYWVTPSIIIMNFVFWFIIGRKMGLKYLLIASIFGILSVVLFFLFYN